MSECKVCGKLCLCAPTEPCACGDICGDCARLCPACGNLVCQCSVEDHEPEQTWPNVTGGA